MAALPYMPLYVADYLADTAHLSTQAHGAYLLLIMNYWQRGEALPCEDRKLARIARMTDEEWAGVRDDIADFFTDEDGFWRHGRIEAELNKVREKSEKASSAGKASAQRRSNERSTDAQQTFNHTDTDTDTDKKKDKAKALSKKGTRLPDDWEPDAGGGWEFAVSLLGATVSGQELMKFRDYWKAASGAKGVKLDWDATWRNWVRSAAERKGHSPPKRQTYSEAANEIIQEMREHERAKDQSNRSDVQRISADAGRFEVAVEYLPALGDGTHGRGGS
jgi:uncharacterized protein YdaU (DUF1376 family)